MKILKYITVCFTVFFLVACGENFFDSVTEIDIPKHEAQLAVRANFNATYRDFTYVWVNHTLGILDSASYVPIKDAQVDLFEGDVLKHHFQYIESADSRVEEQGWYMTDSVALEEGKTYTLQVTDGTFGTIEATQKVPSKVPLLAGTYVADNVVDRYGDRRDEVTIEFQDPAGEKNYYTISASATYRFENADTSFVIDRYFTSVYPVDPVFEEFGNYGNLYFSDASFDGELYTLRFGVSLREQVKIKDILSGPPEKVGITLTAVSKDNFLFEKTVTAYYDNKDNPFAEPVVIHENIEGGSGIFSLMISDEFEIDL